MSARRVSSLPGHTTCLCCTVRVPSGAPVATPGKLTLRRASAERSVALEACACKRKLQTQLWQVPRW